MLSVVVRFCGFFGVLAAVGGGVFWCSLVVVAVVGCFCLLLVLVGGIGACVFHELTDPEKTPGIPHESGRCPLLAWIHHFGGGTLY